MSSCSTVLPAMQRSPGRPKVAESAKLRMRHIQCAALLLGGRFPAKRVASLFGISRRTAYNWLNLALTYDEPEAGVIRRMRASRN